MMDANGGLGEPAFLFYSPLYHHLAAAAAILLGGRIFAGMEAVNYVTQALAVVVFFTIFRHCGLSEKWSAFGAFSVVASPYFLFLISQFGALPSALAILPTGFLIFASAFPSIRRNVNPWVSIAVAWLIFQHLITAFIVLLCLPVFLAVTWWAPNHNVKIALERLGWWALSVTLGLGIAAIYFLPAFTGLTFISPKAWWATLWLSSFCFPLLTHRFGSFWWLAQWPIALLVLAMLAITTIELRRLRAKKDSRAILAWAFLATAWAALFFTSELSYPLWSLSGILRSVQFPFRFLCLSTSAGVLANILCLAQLPTGRGSRSHRAFLVLPLLVGFALTGLLLLHPLVEKKPLPLDSHVIDNHAGSLGRPEYIPATAENHKPWRNYLTAGGLAGFCAARNMTCETLFRHANAMAWRIESAQRARVILPLFGFPAWELTTNGSRARTPIDPETGLMSATVNPGVTRIEAKWVALPSERIGRGVSLISLCLLVALALFRAWRRVGT